MNNIIVVKKDELTKFYDILSDERFWAYSREEFPYIGSLCGDVVYFEGMTFELENLYIKGEELAYNNLRRTMQPSRWTIIWNCIFNWRRT